LDWIIEQGQPGVVLDQRIANAVMWSEQVAHEVLQYVFDLQPPGCTSPTNVDFDGDRKTDILWQHTSGAVAMWLMNGTTISSMGVPGAAGSDWQIKGAGDFNGDSKADILWQHTSGVVAIWLMNGLTISSMGAPGAVGSDWQMKGVGDFDGDGKADILWQHTSGTVAIWLMNGTTISSVGVPGGVGNDWQMKN
jgi:hypothetical protein